MLPEFGRRLRSFLFEPTTVGTRRLLQEQIQQALRQWEPRVEVQSVNVEPDDSDPRFQSLLRRMNLLE